ncbi:gliding motility lipoprotein GldD [Croceitalea sp. MTPC9]|uniref:gliding motility lipoprotein GldD n=1 Tax=unclassified Croceitalea TaxID=2632280 RepID=UPI002B3D1931|nr:gliding motility lipoprotein GldD [Croceitalea sp. MTPC6]GMN16880.1 gliding motility lipoprotein GldD [Croceitalea sp. MTPC9]
MSHRILIVLIAFIVLAGCKEEVFPKPKAMLRLDFPKTEYGKLDTKNYVFEMNKIAKVKIQNENAMTIDYPTIKGSIYITYKKVGEDLNTLLRDSQKLSYEHAAKADNIIEQPFVNPPKEVYGMFYEVTGNAASQSQFYVTDSINHFVTGSLYFYAKPNYDSIYPATNYLQKDIRRIMESMEWKD